MLHGYVGDRQLEGGETERGQTNLELLEKAFQELQPQLENVKLANQGEFSTVQKVQFMFRLT